MTLLPGFTDIAMDFPQPWTWLSVIANIPLAFLTGGKGLQAFGIKFATEQMMISPLMVQYMPHPIPVVRRCRFTLGCPRLDGAWCQRLTYWRF